MKHIGFLLISIFLVCNSLQAQYEYFNLTLGEVETTTNIEVYDDYFITMGSSIENGEPCWFFRKIGLQGELLSQVCFFFLSNCNT
jgi:hypothetical protein